MGPKEADLFAWKPFPRSIFIPCPPHIEMNVLPPPSRYLALESNNDCDSDFFGAERSIAESGGEGSRERWSNSRLRLPSVAMALLVTTAFSAVVMVSMASFFI
jgi:hypothetical protein